MHTYLENEVMYPRVRALLPELEDDVLESYEEHHVADVLVMELVAMKPDRRALRRQDDRAHRERPAPHRGGGARVVPQGARGLGRNTLREIGEEMAEARKGAPTRPSQLKALKKTIDAMIK